MTTAERTATIPSEFEPRVFHVHGQEVRTKEVSLSGFMTIVKILGRALRSGTAAQALSPDTSGNAILWAAIEVLDEDDVALLVSCFVDKQPSWIKQHFRMGWALSAITSGFLQESVDLVELFNQARVFAGRSTTPPPSRT